MSFADIERAIKELATRARDGELSIDELQGGTFTISNGGIYGSLLSTPILNPPQSGILGMHKIEKRAVIVEDSMTKADRVVSRPMMYVALSYDHRMVDGEEAVSFLVQVKERLEDLAEGSRVIYLKADEGLAYSEVMKVMDLVRAAGVEEVALIAEKKVQG